jgi:hypothetical protein
MAPIAGATLSHKPTVTIMEVMYPNGWIPTRAATAPANNMSTHALTKNSGPALASLKKSFIVPAFEACIGV